MRLLPPFRLLSEGVTRHMYSTLKGQTTEVSEVYNGNPYLEVSVVSPWHVLKIRTFFSGF